MKIDESLAGKIRKATETNSSNRIFLLRKSKRHGDRVSMAGSINERPGYDPLYILKLYEEKEAGENLCRDIARRFSKFCSGVGYTEIQDIIYQTAHAPLYSEDSDDFPYIHAWEANFK